MTSVQTEGMVVNNICNLDDSRDEISVFESNQLIRIQKDIMEVVISESDYQVALDALCHAIEGVVPDALASILLYDESQSVLILRAAPNIPEPAKLQLSELVPGNEAGSCAAAVYNKEPIFVCDTTNDSRWKNLLGYVRDFNIHACWSMPIFDKNKEVLGSFALSSFERREPSKFQKDVLATAANLVSLILLRESLDKLLYRAANYDHLTNLPNRSLFNMRFDHAVAKANRNKSRLAVIFIDLDDFKVVNDKFGHETGDLVLSKAAARMAKCIRREDSLSRFGGDEFILLVENSEDSEELKLIARKLLAVLEKPMTLPDGITRISASLGISLYPSDGMSASELIRNADKAMYIAKSVQSDKIQFYSPTV